MTGHGEGKVDLKLRVKRFADDSLLHQVVFSLEEKNTHKILEESTKLGEISFEGLEVGIYSIKITHQDKTIGKIDLDLTL